MFPKDINNDKEKNTMLDEKNKKPEELSDEQMDGVTGGGFYGASTVDPLKKPRKCINPNCNVMLPYNYPTTLCKNCMLKQKESNVDFSPFDPKPINH